MVSAVALISFYGTSVSQWYFEAIIFMFLAWTALILTWLTRLIAATWKARPTATRSLRWMPVPLIFLGVAAALYVDGPLWVRFSLSEAGLEQYAKEIAGGEGPSPECRWAGLYRVCGGEAIPGGSRFRVKDWPLMESRGFVWSPETRPLTDTMDDEYRHLTGPWYGWKGWDGQ